MLTRLPKRHQSLVAPPSGGGGLGFPNQPAWTLVNDQPWDTVVKHTPQVDVLGWTARTNNSASGDDPKLTIQIDATAPQSPSNVFRGAFLAGDPGGSAPWSIQRELIGAEQQQKMYVAFYCMHNSAWSNVGVSGLNTGTKDMWIEGVKDGGFTYSSYDGANMNFGLFQQHGPDRGMLSNVGSFSNASFLAFRGSWKLTEMIFIANSANGTGNGEFHCWIDNVKTHQYTDVDYVMGLDRKWKNLLHEPTYGGAGGANPNVPADQYKFIDHIRILTSA